jgi:SAM-dependent methyltransferase
VVDNYCQGKRSGLSEKKIIALQQEQKEQFGKIIAHPDASFYSTELYRQDTLIRLNLIHKTYRRCLEIGSDSGWFGKKLMEKKAIKSYIGIDIRKEALKNPEDDQCLLIAARAEFLPLKEASFNLVIAFHLIEHIPNPVLGKKELRRIAAPGAHIALAVPLGYDTDPCHYWHFMTAWGWKRFLRKKYGLTCIEGGVYTTTSTQFIGLFSLAER